MRNKLIVALLLTAGCKALQSTPETEPKLVAEPKTPTAGPAETLLMEWTEQYSNVEKPATVIAANEKEWQALWKAIGKQEAPVADLQVYYGVAVFLGQRNTGGYSVKLLDPVVREGKTVIPFVEKKPSGIVMQVITYPYAVRLYPKTGTQVVVEPAAP